MLEDLQFTKLLKRHKGDMVSTLCNDAPSTSCNDRSLNRKNMNNWSENALNIEEFTNAKEFSDILKTCEANRTKTSFTRDI